MMNINMRRRLSYSVCMLYACAVLVGSVASDGRYDDCIPEQCWSTSVISDRCTLECELWAKSADDDASLLPVLADKRAPNFIRIGKSGFVDGNKRYSAFLRIGRTATGDKRYSSFVRIGRAGASAAAGHEAETPQRRAYHPLMSLDKRRHSSFVRIGRNGD